MLRISFTSYFLSSKYVAVINKLSLFVSFLFISAQQQMQHLLGLQAKRKHRKGVRCKIEENRGAGKIKESSSDFV